ncbi:MAG: DUF998 domain-containing protein [Acidobacteria bacterium]|nr:DUF998 domain-containing protein [Acidobacteriota bacterium]
MTRTPSLAARDAGRPPKALLISGIAAPLLYGVADLAAGVSWDAYSFRDQTISELGAKGAPSRLLFAVLLVGVYSLIVAFGIGIRRAAGPNRRLRIVGTLLVALGVMALTVGQLASMELRGVEQGLSGALHLAEGAAAMVVIFTAMGIAATAFGVRFRWYTIATVMLTLAFGAWSAMDTARVGQGLPTPWVGVKERIFWYSYQSWFAVLALTVLKAAPVSGPPRHDEARRRSAAGS